MGPRTARHPRRCVRIGTVRRSAENDSNTVLLLCGVGHVARGGRAQSQATTGQITGQVVDNSAAVLPGATVTITSADTGFTARVVTGDDGLYTLALIPPGTYEIKAELAGFQTATISKTVVTVGSNLSVNVTLPVATWAENVTVTSRASAVETNSSRQTNTLNSKAIENRRSTAAASRTSSR